MIIKKYYVIIILFSSLFYSSCENFILGPEPENTPENNFNILWKEFDRYYPSFIIRNINWDTLYSIYKPRITPQTSEDEFWDITIGLLSNFNDIHVFMYNWDHTKHYESSRIGNSFDFDIYLIKTKYLNLNYKTAGNGNFTYGRFPGDSIGYIYIRTFSNVSTWYHDIDIIVKELSDVKSIIIDVRDNYGGYEDVFAYIASTFTDKPVNYAEEIYRNGPNHNDFSSPVVNSVIPDLVRNTFTKRTILLTNKKTMSMGELFSLFFQQLPNSEQIGEFTAGGLGATRMFQLPNGWTYYMPVLLHLTISGINLENVGVEPDIYAWNSEEGIKNGYDNILETALNHLKVSSAK